MSDLIVEYAQACCTNPATAAKIPTSAIKLIHPTIYIYTQGTVFEPEFGYFISNIDLNGDDPKCDDKFAVNNVFVPVEQKEMVEVQANICRNILVAAGCNVVIVKF